MFRRQASETFIFVARCRVVKEHLAYFGNFDLERFRPSGHQLLVLRMKLLRRPANEPALTKAKGPRHRGLFGPIALGVAMRVKVKAVNLIECLFGALVLSSKTVVSH